MDSAWQYDIRISFQNDLDRSNIVPRTISFHYNEILI